jgi:hypothetical protein
MGGTSQPWMAQPQQPTPDQIAALTPPPPPPAPATSGYNSDLANPAAMPIASPVAPSTTADLENRAGQAPQQFAQALQTQQQPDPNAAIAARIAQQQQIPQGPPNLSPENPYAPLVADATQKWQSMQPPPDRGPRVRSLLQNFFAGMGSTMMAEAGLPTPDSKRQQQFQNMTTLTQLATGWENQRHLQNYHDALTAAEQQQTAFRAQQQPLQLQQAQLALQQGQQALPTVRPVMSAADLASLGVPSDLASQFENKPLSEGDMRSLRQMAVAGQKQLFDYGQDGTGPNRGIWLMDKNYAPIKQIATVSETGRSTALAKLQAQQQNNLIKSASAPVYAYEPTSKQTVLTTMGDARNGGMQAIRGVKESDIRNDMHDTRVLNDVAVKANAVMDASAAMDSWNPAEKQAVANILTTASKDSNWEVGAFGMRVPTASLNAMLNSDSMHALSPAARNYVIGVLSLRESAMGLQKVLTGSARANEAQINALQATIPGLEISGNIVRQKLGAFTQNVDMLRQGIPRMPGIDVVPIKSMSTPQQGSVTQTTGTSGFDWNRFPVVGAPPR